MNTDFCFAVEDADEARYRNQLHFQPRVAFKQAPQPRGDKHDANALGDTQTDFSQRRDGLVDLFLSQQCDVFHRFGVFEQGLPRRGQFVALGMLYKQCSAQVLFDALNVPCHGAMGGIKALGGSQQAAAALQLQEVPHVIPVEHDQPPRALHQMWLTDDCAKTHKPWVKSRVCNTKIINRMV